MYELPKFNILEVKEKIGKSFKNKFVLSSFLFFVLAVAVGFFLSTVYSNYLPENIKPFFKKIEVPVTINLPLIKETGYVSSIPYEQSVINTVKQASPSVVSIIISKYLPVYEQQFVDPFGDNMNPFFNFQIPQYVQKGTEKKEIGGGSGFVVSEDGLILTNKHVVSDTQAEYTVLTNDGQKFTAKVLARDPVQDLAIIKIELADKTIPAIKLGDSSGIKIGQGAIAIGNALGEFRNTVSVGIVSGLGRTIDASGSSGVSETLEGIIQTDAAINSGNSGGPLLNLNGEVIGINTAIAQGAQSIGFAIPINMAKRDIDQVVATNKITYPFLGVRYVLANDQVKEKYKLFFDYGALVLKGDKGEVAITKDSAADKAGLKEKDLILEINGEKITQDNSMAKIIQKYNPNDKITLKVIRGEAEISVDVILGERI